MITSVQVTNYQALQKVYLGLGRFTVIQGPSSSGKSGLIRALRLLVSNARGTTYISRGQKTTVVSVTVAGTTVQVARGAINRYQVGDQEYTKVGSDVPEAVTKVLRMAPVNPVNFAGQFDRPYLLDETSGAVARTLGELTNVTVILNAAREAARRRLAVAGELKTREAQLATLTTQAEAFRSLPGRMAAVSEAEEALSVAEELVGKCARLVHRLATLEVAEASVARLTGEAAPLPDDALFEAVEDATIRLDRFRLLVGQLGTYNAVATDRRHVIDGCDKMLANAEEEIHRVLVDTGTCPLCGQSTVSLPTPV